MHPGKKILRQQGKACTEKTVYANLSQDTVLKHSLTVPIEDTTAATTLKQILTLHVVCLMNQVLHKWVRICRFALSIS